MTFSSFTFTIGFMILTVFPEVATSQPITFERTYGGALDEIGFSVRQTTDGGFTM